MKYEFKSLKQILDLFNNNDVLWATEMSNLLLISRTIVHKYLKELTKQKKLKKVWKWPHTKYKLTNPREIDDLEWFQCKIGDDYIPDFKVQKIFEEIFYKFTADWNILKWFIGMKEWCEYRNLNLEEKTKNYISINNHINSIQNSCWLLNVSDSFWKHFENVYLDKVFYADQYKWMEEVKGHRHAWKQIVK